jgi:LPXTG-motif cell wall-anchored protein
MTENSTLRLRTVLGLVSAALTAAVLVPTTAAAAPDVPPLSALTDRGEDGKTKPVSGKPGEQVAPVLGVANLSGAPVEGAAVQIRAFNDLDLPRTFTNCQYYTDSNLDGAWCQFDEELAVDGKYALTDFRVAIAPDATETENDYETIVFRGVTPEEVTAAGGIEAMAKRDSRTNQSTAGTQGALRLEARALPLPGTPHPIGFAFVDLILPSASPSTKPSSPAPSTPPTRATSSPTAAPTPPPADGGEGGGLPLTGSATTTAVGIGAGLLIAGGALFLLTRRRRTQFNA